MNTATAQQALEVRRLEEAGEWLLRLREDAVSEQEVQQWLDWCEVDPQNLDAFQRIQSLWRGVPDPSVPVRIARRQPRPARRRWQTGGWKTAALAAAAVAAVGAGLLFERLARLDSMTMANIEAPPGANRSSLLPDGSQLELSAGSSIGLNYSHSARELKLGDGMAFFSVRPDRSRPFVVHAGSLRVTAIGTSFNVRSHGDRVIVTVKEGLVRIDKPDGDTVRAKAGYQLLYDASLRETVLRPAEPDAELAWRQGRLVYDGEPLDSVLGIVNRYSAKKIVLDDAKLGRIRYTGTVFTDSIENWVGALPRAFPVTVEEGPEQLTLTARQ